MSPEVKNRGISGHTKRTSVLQNLFVKKNLIHWKYCKFYKQGFLKTVRIGV